MTQHTPGPWELVAGDDYYITAESYPAEFPHKFKSDDLGSAVAYVGNRPDDFGEANARLIAAAPDMLAALDLIERELTADGWTDKFGPLAQIRAAIAKARGPH